MTVSNDLMKRHYCEVLLELSREKPLGKITASDVIARAGTARQTFYNHFRNINDLISFLPIDYVRNAISSVYDPDGVSVAYNYAVEHKEFFSQLPLHEGQNNFRVSFIAWMEQLYFDELLTPELTEEETMRRTIAIIQFCSGVVDSFLEWCRLEMPWPVDMLVQVHNNALPQLCITP